MVNEWPCMIFVKNVKFLFRQNYIAKMVPEYSSPCVTKLNIHNFHQGWPPLNFHRVIVNTNMLRFTLAYCCRSVSLLFIASPVTIEVVVSRIFFL